MSGTGDSAAVQVGNGKNSKQQGQEIQSVPDSPMMETNSSFGSTSSSPSAVANLPPIKIHVDDGGSVGSGVRMQDQKVVGIEEQFAQLGVGGGAVQKQDEGFAVLSSPPLVEVNVSAAAAVAGVPISSAAAAAAEYHNRVVSDDERSGHGVPVGHRVSPPMSQPQTQTQSQPQVQDLPPQFQQKSTGVVDLPSPDSVSRYFQIPFLFFFFIYMVLAESLCNLD